MRLARWLTAVAVPAAVLLTAGLSAPIALAATGVQTQTIPAPADASFDRFGFAADVNEDNGTVALVGAPGTNPPTEGDVGKAFVFTHQGATWPLQQELVPTPSRPQDFFGGAVALSGDGKVALVGAPANAFASSVTNEPASPGAAFVFTQHNGQWTQQAVLATSPASPAADNFGFAVALSRDGHEALIGAPGENQDEGAAYLFAEHGNTWALESKLVDPGNSPQPPTPGDSFGFAVALNPEGHEALIGADQGGLAGQAPAGTGFADIYVQNGGTWPAVPSQQLNADDAVFGDAFGNAVALNGDGHVALIGAEGKNGFQGAAYTFAFTGGTWSQQQEVTGSDSVPPDLFGYAVAIDGNADIAKISAPFADGFQGRAYRFAGKVGSWAEVLEQMEAGPSDYGTAVALNHDGKVELAGADGEDSGGTGVVYAYEFG